MFGGGNVKLEATVTIDISKTDIPLFHTLQVCLRPRPLSLSLSLSSSSALAPSGHTYHSSSATLSAMA